MLTATDTPHAYRKETGDRSSLGEAGGEGARRLWGPLTSPTSALTTWELWLKRQPAEGRSTRHRPSWIPRSASTHLQGTPWAPREPILPHPWDQPVADGL